MMGAARSVERLQAEHAAAIASLTPAQRAAVARLGMARRLTHFRGGLVEDQLAWILARDAANRELTPKP